MGGAANPHLWRICIEQHAGIHPQILLKILFFYYGIYYYAQAMHQVGGEAAATADTLVPQLLIESQRNDGSWMGRGGEEKNIGSVYATTLAMLSLSVRYHCLPIYQK